MKEKIFKLLAFFKKPPAWVFWLTSFSTLCFVTAALVFVFLKVTGVFVYIAYALAATTLGYSVYLFVRLAPIIKAGIMERLKRRPFTKNLTEDYSFRTIVFASCSLTVNLAFVAFHVLFAILTGNGWYASLAGYYFLLSLLRGGVFLGNRRAKRLANGDERKAEGLKWKNYGLCGGALFLLDMGMATAITLMVLGRKPTEYTEITAIVFAAYSSYKIGFAIYNSVKAKSTREPIVQCFRNIGLADAAVSLLSLQVTLIATFSEGGEDMTLLNALTGAFVCLLTAAIGIGMLARAKKK